MNRLPDEAPARGVFVMLDGALNQYPRADRWVIRNGCLSVRRKFSRFGFQEFAVFGRFDQVGYMRDPA